MKLLNSTLRILSRSAVKNLSSVRDIALTKPLGSTLTVKGWVRAVRKLKEFVFIDVTDGSSNHYLQVLVPKKACPWPIQWGTSLDVTGKINENKTGQIELLADKINVIGEFNVSDNYPFTPKQKQSYDQYRTHLHLRPKIQFFSSVFRFRSAAAYRIHQYFIDNSFVGVHTPIITSNDCEGSGEIFTVQSNCEIHKFKKTDESVSKENSFFDCPAYLTVSGQLHLEIAARSFTKVYTFNPTFRAENSSSRFHLSEFLMLEVEESFVTDIQVVLNRIEECLKDIIEYLICKHSGEMEYILQHSETNVFQHMKLLENIMNKPFTVMTFAEAKALVEKNKDKIVRTQFHNPNSLVKEEELFLVSNNNNVPVFVIDWPKSNKPFYMKECLENKDLVKGVDLLVPNIGELCGGSLREDNYDTLKKKLSDASLLKKLSWYLDLRKHGNVPTGGFGMGFERFLQLILNIQNIKDTIPFPRWPHSLQL